MFMFMDTRNIVPPTPEIFMKTAIQIAQPDGGICSREFTLFFADL